MNPIRVLIASNDAAASGNLTGFLEGLGITDLLITETIEQTIAEAGRKPPGLIILDISLPGAPHPAKTAETIFKEHNIPVILLAQISSDDLLAKFADINHHGIIFKPVTSDQFKATLAAAMKQAGLEKSLLESEEKFKAVLEKSTEITAIFDEHGKFKYASPMIAEVSGFEVHQMIGTQLSDAVHRDDFDQISEIFKKALENPGRAIKVSDFRVRSRSIGWVWLEGSITSMLDTAGIEGLLFYGHGIMERKKAEVDLRSSEERFREMADMLPTIVCETDMNLKLTYINRIGLETFGFTQDDIEEGINVLNLFIPKDKDAAGDRISMLHEGKQLPAREYTLTKADGTDIPVLLHSGPIIRNGEVVGVRTSVTDLTGQKRVQAYLERSQTMEAISTLASGIAHEFNNALAGITGNIELLRMDSEGDESTAKYIERMMGSVARMASLTNKLLAYAQGGKYQPVRLPASMILEESLSVIQHSVSPNVALEARIIEEPVHIEADTTQFQLVLSAIIANADEAMTEEGGLIRVNAVCETLDNHDIGDGLDRRSGEYIHITIIDNGKGMSQTDIGRIFDPFFSTKFQGRGMGMSAAFGIVQNHGGWINVESELGRGSTVHVYLPTVEAPEHVEPTEVHEPASGTGNILLIEDETDVMEVSLVLLERLGYNVIVAENGAQALKLVKEHASELDLALLDLGLPDIPGEEVFAEMIRISPGLKVVVLSGFSLEGPAQSVIDAGARGFLQKPYTLPDLSNTIKRVLGEKPA